MRIRLAIIEAQYDTNAYSKVLELVKLSMPHCVSQRDKQRCCSIEVRAYAALGQLDLAVSAGLQGLDILQIPVPGNDAAAVIFAVSHRRVGNDTALTPGRKN